MPGAGHGTVAGPMDQTSESMQFARKQPAGREAWAGGSSLGREGGGILAKTGKRNKTSRHHTRCLRKRERLNPKIAAPKHSRPTTWGHKSVKSAPRSTTPRKTTRKYDTGMANVAM